MDQEQIELWNQNHDLYHIVIWVYYHIYPIFLQV